jgi:hypothetical protein
MNGGLFNLSLQIEAVMLLSLLSWLFNSVVSIETV